MIAPIVGTCSTMDLEKVDKMFFEELRYPNQETAAICSACPVQQECYDWATEMAIPQGVFGGERGPDRRRRLDINIFGVPNAA